MRDQPPSVDDRNLVGEPRHLREHVAGDEHGAAGTGERAQEVTQPANPLRVETVRRLVEHEQARRAEERGGHAQTLAHGERVGADPAALGAGQLDVREHLLDSGAVDAAALARTRRWLRPDRLGW